tara:strand:+ start:3072 stop:5321 length:2250 start_codon:yes stop_codon:yes gene_type:complete
MPSYDKKDFKETNVEYLNKDFGQIKNSLVRYAKSYFPNTYKDFNETSPGMMLLEMSAYVGDVMSFYIDQQYREMLLPLAEERRNIINMAKMFGYKVKPIVPAYVDLTFTSEVNADTANPSIIDYSDAGVFGKGIQVSSLTNSDIIFETLDVVDFSVTSSTDTRNVLSVNNSTGIISSYQLSRTVRAVSGQTKTKAFTIGSPQKFLKLNLPDTDVVDIISCVDSNGNNWYEVDFLAQDKVPIPTHYTSDENRDSAYYNLDGSSFVTDVPVPYSLSYINTSKRFVRETNVDNTTSLVFGNGILRNGSTIGEQFIDLEQAGIIIPGQSGDLNQAIDPLLGDEYSTLGESPSQTTLVITYRVGGGISSNVSAGDLTNIDSTTVTVIGGDSGATLINANNATPARGGRDEESTEEIREKARAFFSTQNRCVTKEDYEARVLNIPSKFGNIAKVYVSRENLDVEYYDIQASKQNIENELTQLNDQLANIQSTLTSEEVTQVEIDFVVERITAMLGYSGASNNISRLLTEIPDSVLDNPANLGAINIHILAYDKNKQLVGNPVAEQLGTADSIPFILKNNIKQYLDNFRILTDFINIIDGFIINFGVFFDVVAHKYADKNQVKLLCIQKIKDYFKIEKMQFSQPIFTPKLEYELMQIDGVLSVNHVTISQYEDYKVSSDDKPSFDSPLYRYSFDETENDGLGGYQIDGGGTNGYGFKYDFSPGEAFVDGVILPPSPKNPGVFELKNPNQNIKGVVR